LEFDDPSVLLTAIVFESYHLGVPFVMCNELEFGGTDCHVEGSVEVALTFNTIGIIEQKGKI